MAARAERSGHRDQPIGGRRHDHAVKAQYCGYPYYAGYCDPFYDPYACYGAYAYDYPYYGYGYGYPAAFIGFGFGGHRFGGFHHGFHGGGFHGASGVQGGGGGGHHR